MWVWFSGCGLYSDRPAAIPVHVKHMADTSNFDEFEEKEPHKGQIVITWLSCDYHMIIGFSEESEGDSKDWVFQNFTFKRFEGLTQRGHVRV